MLSEGIILTPTFIIIIITIIILYYFCILFVMSIRTDAARNVKEMFCHCRLVGLDQSLSIIEVKAELVKLMPTLICSMRPSKCIDSN